VPTPTVTSVFKVISESNRITLGNFRKLWVDSLIYEIGRSSYEWSERPVILTSNHRALGERAVISHYLF
jgi:hypothetical protein